MSSNILIPKAETECLIFSITKKCETVLKQAHKKPQQTLKIKLSQTRETFSLHHLLIMVLTLNG